MEEEGVSNNKTIRVVSNRLDSAMGLTGKSKEGMWSSKFFTYVVYYSWVGTAKYVCGNSEGARAEFRSGSKQFGRC